MNNFYKKEQHLSKESESKDKQYLTTQEEATSEGLTTAPRLFTDKTSQGTGEEKEEDLERKSIIKEEFKERSVKSVDKDEEVE